MRRFRLLLLLLPSLGLGLRPVLAASKEKPAADAAPRLLSTEGGDSRWKNTKQLQAYAAKGDPQACFELGTRMLDGDDEVPADLAGARALMETAAAGGVADAHFRLGKIYHDGRGVPQDYARALEHYVIAARQGVPEAQHNIGAMLVSARGVKRDYVEGLAWLLVAEESGAASTAPQQVRDRLARRPADLAAAAARAKELMADLPHAIVRTGPAAVPVIAPSAPAPPLPANAVAKPTVPVTVAAPKMDPLVPVRLAPPEPPATAPR